MGEETTGQKDRAKTWKLRKRVRNYGREINSER